jgi:uncharacterized protein YcfL
MKKVLAVVLALIVSLSVVSCGSHQVKARNAQNIAASVDEVAAAVCSNVKSAVKMKIMTPQEAQRTCGKAMTATKHAVEHMLYEVSQLQTEE